MKVISHVPYGLSQPRIIWFGRTVLITHRKKHIMLMHSTPNNKHSIDFFVMTDDGFSSDFKLGIKDPTDVISHWKLNFVNYTH